MSWLRCSMVQKARSPCHFGDVCQRILWFLRLFLVVICSLFRTWCGARGCWVAVGNNHCLRPAIIWLSYSLNLGLFSGLFLSSAHASSRIVSQESLIRELFVAANDSFTPYLLPLCFLLLMYSNLDSSTL